MNELFSQQCSALSSSLQIRYSQISGLLQPYGPIPERWSSLSLLTKALCITLGLLLFRVVVSQIRSPLRQFNGPLLARYTDLWRMLDHYKGRPDITQLNLHRKYGSAVRLGTNCVSVNDPGLIKTLYSTRGTYVKSDLYSVNDAYNQGQRIPNVFSVRDRAFHSKYIRAIQKMYNMTSTLALESLMDREIEAFCQRLEVDFVDESNAGEICEIDEWIAYWSWDTIGTLSTGEPYGFIDQASDIHGVIDTAKRVFQYFAIVGQVPVLDRILDKNRFGVFGPRTPAFVKAAQHAAKLMYERKAGKGFEESSQEDFLAWILELQEKQPELITDRWIIMYLVANGIAGSDTVAAAASSAMYYITRTPGVAAKLREELEAADLKVPAAYSEVSRLPYLTACIREALRIHSPIGMMLERVVPPEGLTLPDGRSVAPGTIVGMNAWVVHRNEEVFGPNVEQFVPERWLQGSDESETDYQARRKNMNDSDLSFGAGNRVCLGKNLSLVLVWKVVATLMMRFEFELEDPNQDLRIHNYWFVRQQGFRVKMKRRA